MDLKNNTILITGGTSGFGLEFATRLIELGNTVIITGRNQAKLDQTKEQLPGVHTFRSDVSDPKDITLLYEQVTRQFPALNFLINNAGEMRKISLHDTIEALPDIILKIMSRLAPKLLLAQTSKVGVPSMV